jgi:CelD/BcsL family acetyltransferase involved in cellulose biosynthesis
MEMTVEWTHDPRAFVARDWAPLVLADPEATFFHTPRYLKLYWEEFGAEHLHLATVVLGGQDVAAAAFDLRDDVLTWLGGFDVTDYLGPVGIPEARDAAAKELMTSLASRPQWRTADLAGLPKGGRWLPALVEAARDAELQADPGDDGVAPLLELPDTYDAYLEGLPGKLRHEIRRKERRLREALPDAHLVEATPDTLARDLDRFVDLHRSSTGAKGKFMVPGVELFFRRLAEALLPDRTFRLVFLEAGEDKVAGAVGFRWHDRFFLYNSAFDHHRASLSPGMVLVAEMIRGAIEEGCRTFDMLKGDLRYKYRFGARPRRIGRLRLHRR